MTEDLVTLRPPPHRAKPSCVCNRFAGQRAPTLRSAARYRLLARVAQSGEVLFDAQEDTASGGLDGGALRLNIRPAGFAYRRNFHERRLARLSEILEMCLHTFHQWSSLLFGGTSLRHVPAARLYDRNILSKSRGYREQHKYCKNQTRPCHGTLQSFEHS